MWVIKRSDGKYFKGGAGDPDWRGDKNWKNEIHSATIYNKPCYLEPALAKANEMLTKKWDSKAHKRLIIEPIHTCKAVPVEIKEIEE